MFGISKKNEEQEIWKSFYGRGNSDSILEEKAKLLAPILIDWARSGTLQLINHLKENDEYKGIEEKFIDIFVESLILYIHYTDRVAFQLLEVPKRNLFMDKLMMETMQILLEGQSGSAEKMFLDLTLNKTYNERQIEYGSYKLTAEKDEGLGGTLFWEFGKRIASTIGGEPGFIGIYSQICIVGSLQYLQLPKLFSE